MGIAFSKFPDDPSRSLGDFCRRSGHHALGGAGPDQIGRVAVHVEPGAAEDELDVMGEI